MSEIKDDVRDGVPSASKLGALFLCPGRERLEKGLPDQKSEVASRGNAMHEAMAGGDPTMSHDEQDLVKRMREELVTLKLVVFGEEPLRTKEIFKEQRMWAKRKNYSGVPDFLGIRQGRALVVDYKTGRIPVSHAKDNWQLKGLAVLAKQNHLIDEVTVAIVQPYAGAFTYHRYDRKALALAVRQVSSLLRRVNAKKTELNPGEKQCRYCKAKPTCPALQHEAGELVAAGNRAMTPTQMADVLEKAELVDKMVKAVRTKAKDLLAKDDRAIPGWSLKPGSARRKITDVPAAFSRMTDAGISILELMESSTLAVAKLEKLLRGDGSSAKEARDKLAELLGELIETSTPEPKLEKDGDS